MNKNTNVSNHWGKGPKNYQRPDARIYDEVCEALFIDPWVDATDIIVEVNDGEVILRGQVANREQKKRAEVCAEEISGVVDVLNYLTLKPDHGLIGDMSIRANMI